MKLHPVFMNSASQERNIWIGFKVERHILAYSMSKLK